LLELQPSLSAYTLKESSSIFCSWISLSKIAILKRAFIHNTLLFLINLELIFLSHLNISCFSPRNMFLLQALRMSGQRHIYKPDSPSSKYIFICGGTIAPHQLEMLILHLEIRGLTQLFRRTRRMVLSLNGPIYRHLITENIVPITTMEKAQ